MAEFIEIHSGPLSLHQAEAMLAPGVQLRLSDECLNRIQACRKWLDEKSVDEAPPMYGINTGFGALCQTRISADDLGKLQENLIKSHACGSGKPIANELVRCILLLKIKSLSEGHSGVSPETIRYLLAFYNAGMYPVIYEAGSLGASGDLAPLAHLSLPLLGLGEVNYNGQIISGAEALKLLELQPLRPSSKEGLALLNGTQFMGGLALHALLRASNLIDWLHVISALSLEAFDGIKSAFHPLISQVRPHAGQSETAAKMREWLGEDKDGPKAWVQDPYSFRCIPQVHGACIDALNYVKNVVECEISSVTDNPLVFPEENLVLSGGNFHGQPLALALDFMALSLSEIGSISERRIYKLVDGQRGLPAFLTPEPGLNSGFMIVQYAAASLVNRNKQRCYPNSADSIDSSRGQEDHVSMGANSAVKTIQVLEDTERILAMELLCAVQAMYFRPVKKLSPRLQKIYEVLRQRFHFVEQDEVMQPLMEEAWCFIRQNRPEPWS